ncbi:MAG: cytidine deaminase [Treponema sp.]|nr:cytidine deaminase [Treponema sp.]
MIDKAYSMLEFSYTPYSHWKVGAALLSADGRIWGGCNVENAAYGPSNCAERTAVFKAVSEGAREFKAIVIVGGHEGNVENYCPPCGVCRQVLAEFCKADFLVIMPRSHTEYKVRTLAELLPESFSLPE